MRIGAWRPHFLKGRRAWVAIGLVLLLATLALLGRWDARRRRPQPEMLRSVAQAGDSIFTVARLRTWLAAREDTLSREEIRQWLEGWVEDQLLAQAAMRQGLDTLHGVAEELHRIRLRYLRGLLEEQSLAETLSISKLELRTWARANEDLLAIPERQLKLSWYVGRDSLALARLVPQLQRSRVRERHLSDEDLQSGQTPYLTRSELPATHAAAVSALEMRGVSPVLPLPGGYVVYQLVGQRPVGWVPDPDADEGTVRAAMLQDLRWKRLQARFDALRDEAVWKVDITPLLEVESGVPRARR